MAGRIQVLPITKHRDEILETIENNYITIIAAPTGSGKTTQIPQYILEDAEKRKKECKMVVTQPRKIAAITIAGRVAADRGSVLGEEIGYQVGLDQKYNNNDENLTKILFCTTGVLVNKFVQLKKMNNYTHVILDEVHEREIDMDLLFVIAKEFLIENSACTKLILMSATMKIEIFKKYFSFAYEPPIVPGIVELQTPRKYKIDIRYLDSSLGGQINILRPGIDAIIYEHAAKIIINEVKSSDKSILVFLPGAFEIETFHAVLQKYKELSESCMISVLYSSLPVKDQRSVFLPCDKPKVILSTNIAETSITLNNVGCVIDFCLVKVVRKVEGSTLSSLNLEYVAMDSLEQRTGRTGRTCDGVVYRMIRKDFLRNLKEYSDPEILRCPLEKTVLRVKKLGAAPPLNFLGRALSPPENEDILKAINVLKELGGLQRLEDPTDAQKVIGEISRLEECFTFHGSNGMLTKLGEIMDALPIEPRLTKLIILGYMFSILEETIVVAAGLSAKSIFSMRSGDQMKNYEQKLIWADGSGCDFNAILNAYNMWRFKTEQGHFDSVKAEENWCLDGNLERKGLHEMRQLIEEIKYRLKEFLVAEPKGNFKVSWEENQKPFILKICAAGAFFPNFFISGQSDEDLAVQMQKEIGDNNPFRTIVFKGMDNKNQVGEVYEEQIKKKLVQAGICKNPNDIKVSVQRLSTKLYVEFPNEEIDKTENSELTSRFDGSSVQVVGRVKTELYRAIKFEQLKFRLNLNVMSPEDCDEYARKHDIFFEPDVHENKKPKNLTMWPEFVIIPIITTKSLQGRVVHIEHIGKFFIQPITDVNEKILVAIHGQVKEAKPEAFSSVEELSKAQLVFVDIEGTFRRAKIDNFRARDQKVRCYLIDFGKFVTAPIKSVFKNSESLDEIFDIPERCFEASLCKLAPCVIKCPKSKWTDVAIKKFKSMALNLEACVEIYSVDDDISSVTLIVNGVSVNDELIKAGYAQECEEIFPRRLNHQDRKEFLSEMTPKEQFVNNISKIREKPVPAPPSDKIVDTIRLKGPNSPMVAKIHSIKKRDQERVTVDPSSANSVVFMDDPLDLHGQLIIAADATQNNRKETIIHETSILPNLPGLPVILGSLFAPDAVFIRDETETFYESLLLGLGGYKSGHPYFAENDCILSVFHEFTKEDAKDINYMRFSMSYIADLIAKPLLAKRDEHIHQNMTELKKTLINVLNRKRSPVAFRKADSAVDWKIKDTAGFSFWNDMFHGGGLYRHIPYPALVPPSKKEIALIREKLVALQKEKVKTQVLECPVCNRKFEENYYHLKIHFNSKMHCDRLQALEKWDSEIESNEKSQLED